MRSPTAMSLSPPRGLAENVPLAPLTTLGTGGAARYLLEVKEEAAAIEALSWARRRGLDTLVLGGGSNVVIADDGFDGLVLRVGFTGRAVTSDGEHVEVTVGAGEDWDDFVAHSVGRGWAGVECLSGIPGRVGATPIQNVGAYGQEVADTIVRVRCLNRDTLALETLTGAACEFAYRDSRFKREDEGRYLVASVTFRLHPGGSPRLDYGDLRERVGATASLATTRRAVLAARAQKAMLHDPTDPDGRSCGSFFLNPIVERAVHERVVTACPGRAVPHYEQPDGRVKLPAAWLIEASGIHKGQRLGNAAISSKHALCIVALPGATSKEVRDLALFVKEQVRARFGLVLEVEPRFCALPPP